MWGWVARGVEKDVSLLPPRLSVTQVRTCVPQSRDTGQRRAQHRYRCKMVAESLQPAPFIGSKPRGPGLRGGDHRGQGRRKKPFSRTVGRRGVEGSWLAGCQGPRPSDHTPDLHPSCVLWGWPRHHAKL